MAQRYGSPATLLAVGTGRGQHQLSGINFRAHGAFMSVVCASSRHNQELLTSPCDSLWKAPALCELLLCLAPLNRVGTTAGRATTGPRQRTRQAQIQIADKKGDEGWCPFPGALHSHRTATIALHANQRNNPRC